MKKIEIKMPEITSTARSERAELIEQFVTEINFDRVNTNFKPITGKQVNILLAMMNTEELYIFFRECQSYKGPFSKRFFGGFKEQQWKS